MDNNNYHIEMFQSNLNEELVVEENQTQRNVNDICTNLYLFLYFTSFCYIILLIVSIVCIVLSIYHY